MRRVTRETDVSDANTRHTTRMAYYPDGKVKSVTDAKGRVATYEYDGLNRLIRVTDPENGLYADEGLIGEYTENGAEIRTYGYKPDSQWTTNPLFQQAGGVYYWYHNDSQGTPQKIVETNGNVVWSAVYDAFGNIRIETDEIVNNHRFAGQYHDTETGLYYNLNRHYDHATGRYMSRDPFGEGLNLYTYVLNNPNTWIDPTGLFFCAFMGFAHGTLDMLGYIPILGIFPDLFNGFLYLMEGDYLAMGLSLIAAIPIIGDIGSGLFKGFRGLFKHLDGVGNTIKKAAQRGLDHIHCMVSRTGACFVAGTLVMTPEGLRPIEEIELGDYVLSRDDKTGETEWKKVEILFITPERKILELEIKNENGKTERLKVTGEHPIWVRNWGWVSAQNLIRGDEIYSSTGGWLRVSNGVWLSGRQTVYNLEIEDFHTYFVGELGLWVHNYPDSQKIKELKNAIGKGNDINVKTQKEAEALIEKARPEIPWRETYGPKEKIGKEIHPPDGSTQDLPHIKWRDWTRGKQKGAEGHIFFEGI